MLNDYNCRWVILEHTGAPDDPQGIHYDLLLEDGLVCRTWRLRKIPILNGPGLEAELLPPHNLVWLDRQDELVSGGRGRARRIFHGFYKGKVSNEFSGLVRVELFGEDLHGILEISENYCLLKTL